MAAKTTTVNGTAIPVGVYTIVAPSFSNTYNWLISSDFTISERDQFTRTVCQQPDHRSGYRSQSEVRIAFNRYNNDIQVPDYQYPNLDVFPDVLMRNDLNLNIGPDPNGPQATLQTTYQMWIT